MQDDKTKNNENPVKEGNPDSIAEDKSKQEKNEYPFPSEKDKQFDSQPEFIERDSNESKDA